MRILLDTHALIWWLQGDPKLSKRAADIIKDAKHPILISAAVSWEISIKIGLGKIRPASLLDALQNTLSEESFEELSITVQDTVRAGMLPPHHRDPFDRLLAAQAQLLNVPILSADKMFDQYSVQRVW